ncbi:hypothetical protein [Paenibacillus hamazuiensis]|uniref:hypothetical protein n=1 Tax=Paenibacillus hamazuiensis TaxID=2936508 RepID=UPI00200E4FD1|nr:hypothetical protein [Paenibacillus hamazuiensis]
MHQSSKEKLVTRPEHQLLAYEFAEAMSLGPAMSEAEIVAGHTSVHEKLRSTPRKTYR